MSEKMTEEEIMTGTLKLSVFDTFPYNELREISDAICNLGYSCIIVNNGNLVFKKTRILPQTIKTGDEK